MLSLSFIPLKSLHSNVTWLKSIITGSLLACYLKLYCHLTGHQMLTFWVAKAQNLEVLSVGQVKILAPFCCLWAVTWPPKAPNENQKCLYQELDPLISLCQLVSEKSSSVPHFTRTEACLMSCANRHLCHMVSRRFSALKGFIDFSRLASSLSELRIVATEVANISSVF